jgi:predicted Zn finger-like uncharacterized protein
MRIACPSCSATYDVPDSLVTVGRVVRCARCGGDWTPVEGTPVQDLDPPPRAAAPPPPPSEPAAAVVGRIAAEQTAEPQTTAEPPRLSAMDKLAAHPAWTQSRLQLRLAWAASLLLIVLAAWSAYSWRSQIINAWPPSARMYAAFGMHIGPSSPR